MFKTTFSKLIAAFAVLTLVAAGMGGLALWSTRRLAAQTAHLTDDLLPSIRALSEVRQAYTAMRFFTSKAMTAAALNEHERIPGMWRSREDARETLKSAKEAYAAVAREDDRAAWAEITAGLETFERGNLKVWDAVNAHDATGAEHAMDQLAPVIAREVDAPLLALVERHASAGKRARDDSRALAAGTTAVTWVAIGLCVAGAIGFSMLIGRAVSRPLVGLLGEARRVGEAFAEGRFETRALPAATNEEFRPVLDAINEAVEAILKPFKVIVDYCEAISHGTLLPHRTNMVKGDVVAMQQSLNRCIDAVKALVGDTQTLVEAALAGKLSTRADPGRHEGEFRRVIEGVNATLDAMTGPVRDAGQVLEQLARRDLTVRVEGAYEGDHAKLRDAVNETASALHDALAQVARAAEQVSSASGQIAATSEAVASGASEQASSLEETSSSLQSMAATTKQTAAAVEEASELASSAQAAAQVGGAAVTDMLTAMEKIRASAQGTSQIIKDINEIAFQTNLLALNAAVEAARAGEAGRGFAVVADEVRSLALRAKEAASRTEGLISEAVREADAGEATAKNVNEVLARITESVGKVTGLVGEVSSTAKEQATGIEQLTQAVAQVSTVTQQNAASSEESASAAQELSGQAQELAATVGQFRLERLERAAVMRRPSRAALPAARA